jgi:hypothetical protein
MLFQADKIRKAALTMASVGMSLPDSFTTWPQRFFSLVFSQNPVSPRADNAS